MAESVAKYQQYEEYKDSGVEWSETIPTHWKTASLSKLFMIKAGGDLQLALFSEIKTLEHQYPIYTNANDSKAVYGYTSKSNFPSDTITVSGRGEVGFAVYRNHEFDAIIRLLVLIPFIKLDGRFFAYFINEVIDFNVQSSAIGQLSTLQISPYKVIIPPNEEQHLISDYLDYETAQIDTLIDKQQTLIQLLKEKRQAVISHAVTKGLKPDAPMKDSGVEWLGEVPEHWVVTKFSHCAQIRNGLVDPKAPDFKKLVLYAPNHIEKGTGKVVYKETAEEQGADSSKYLCYKGEVIYSKIRPALAKVAICEEETALCSADMYPINAVNGLDNRFLYFFMLSDNFTKAAILDSDRVAMPKINRESLSDYRLPVPPVIEQMAICKFIANQNTKLEELESKATKAIQLMQERRTALISAAVTGKIDVRGWRASE